jgi:hypothetical protein
MLCYPVGKQRQCLVTERRLFLLDFTVNIVSSLKILGNTPCSAQLSILLGYSIFSASRRAGPSIYGIDRSRHVLPNKGRTGSLDHRRRRQLRTC